MIWPQAGALVQVLCLAGFPWTPVTRLIGEHMVHCWASKGAKISGLPAVVLAELGHSCLAHALQSVAHF